jgi:hypothetical protein
VRSRKAAAVELVEARTHQHIGRVLARFVLAEVFVPTMEGFAVFNVQTGGLRIAQGAFFHQHLDGELRAGNRLQVAIEVGQVARFDKFADRTVADEGFEFAQAELHELRKGFKGGLFRFEPRSEPETRKDIWLVFCGPLANLLLTALLIILIWRPRYEVQQVLMGILMSWDWPLTLIRHACRASGLSFTQIAGDPAVASFFVALGNLLPLHPLDGGYIFARPLLKHKWFRHFSTAYLWVSTAGWVWLMIFSRR